MNKLAIIFAFVSGGAAGSLVTWQYTKKLYEKRAQEEIDSVKETYAKKDKVNVVKKPEKKTEAVNEKPEQDVKARIKTKYAELSKHYRTGDSSPTAESKPYVISPDDFDEENDYETISLIYFADGVLADDAYRKIDDVDEIVGVESLTHFGEYEDDSVFVRNDKLKCDYEILMDTRTYSEIEKQRPHRREE